MNFTSVKKITIREGDVSNISLNGKVIWSAKGNLDLVNTFHFVSDTDNDVSMFKRIPHDEKWKGEYSLDEGATWTEVSFLQGGDRDPEVTMHMKAGDSLYIRSKGKESGGRLFAYGFRSTAPIYAYGNIWTLLSYYGKHSIDNTFAALFENMTTLITAPDVSASEYSGKYPRDCFSNTFNGCTGLEYIPPIKNVVDEKFEDNAFNRMFNNCTNLHEVEFDFDKWNTAVMGDWNKNTASYGYVTVPESIQVGTGEGQIPQDSSKGIPAGWSITYPRFGFKNVSGQPNTIKLTKSNNAPQIVLEKSNDGVLYESFDIYSGVTLQPNETIYLRGNNKTFSGENGYAHNSFTSTGNIECHGNIMDLCGGAKELTEEFQFAYLFYSMTTLITAPKLPATALTKGVYEYMFYGCSSLKKIQKILPATTLTEYCYESMFTFDSSLTQFPILPATTLAPYCYRHMFKGCKLMETAPMLPATTLAKGCYSYMFAHCESLRKSPERLPATTLFEYSYNHMFFGCPLLTKAPEIFANNIANYCYESMFEACKNLNYIKIHSTTWDYIASQMWVWGVASTGIFVKPKELQIGGGTGFIHKDNVDGIPTGWEVQNI